MHDEGGPFKMNAGTGAEMGSGIGGVLMIFAGSRSLMMIWKKTNFWYWVFLP